MTENQLLHVKKIIEAGAIRTVFQPIISLKDGQLLGHEALSRITAESSIKDIDTLFTLASQHHCLWELEQLCRTRALEAAFRFMVPPYNKKLFINVNPNVLYDQSFQSGFTKEYVNAYQISPSNIIFEITERNMIHDLEGFIAAVEHYRRQDYKIAIDDTGSGYSGLNLISDINPHYIKLDMKLIRHIHRDRIKIALVKGMADLANETNMAIIAEGIETEEELETLIGLGVHYGQGYFIQHPDGQIKDISPEICGLIQDLNHQKNGRESHRTFSTVIENLCTHTTTISPATPVQDVFHMFKNNPHCFGLCITEGDVPKGIITKEKLALKLSGQYGFALYQNKPISHVMDKDFMSVDCGTPVSIVSAKAMARANDRLYDFIVVKKQGKYLGTVTIRDLLTKATEIEIAAAKHQNPLTGLPGNLIIEENLQQCISSGKSYSIAYLDIDNFKAYNDVYGFENGDRVLKLLARVILRHIDQGEFVGHIGGDDFVIIVKEHVEEDFFQHIVSDFEREVLSFYSQSDIENGYITAANRQNIIERFPLTTLTVAAVNNKQEAFEDMFELTEALAVLKRQKKQRHST